MKNPFSRKKKPKVETKIEDGKTIEIEKRIEKVRVVDVDSFRNTLIVIGLIMGLICGVGVYAGLWTFGNLDTKIQNTVAEMNGSVQNMSVFMERVKTDQFDVLLALTILGSGFFLPIGFFVGFLFFNKDFLIKLMRRVRRRNYGFVFLLGSGKNAITMIKDLDRDVIKRFESIWIIERDRIYREVDTNVQTESFDIRAENMIVRGGIPQVFLDINTMRPLRFDTEDASELKQKPELVGAVLMKEIAVEKAKALLLRRTFEMLFVVLAILIVIGAYISFIGYKGTQDIIQNGVNCTQAPLNLSMLEGYYGGHTVVVGPGGQQTGVITPTGATTGGTK
jgi:hypothetical protein